MQIADRDHVFFEYARKETSASIAEMFAGYTGYIQADAKSVYDVLFREPDKPPDDGEGETRIEVGCCAGTCSSSFRTERDQLQGARSADNASISLPDRGASRM